MVQLYVHLDTIDVHLMCDGHPPPQGFGIHIATSDEPLFVWRQTKRFISGSVHMLPCLFFLLLELSGIHAFCLCLPHRPAIARRRCPAPYLSEFSSSLYDGALMHVQSQDMPDMAALLSLKHSLFTAGIVSTAALVESLNPSRDLSTLMAVATQGTYGHPTPSGLANPLFSSTGDAIWDAESPLVGGDWCYIDVPEGESHPWQDVCGTLPDYNMANMECSLREDLTAVHGYAVWQCKAAV